jgi:hypothetical protein
MKERALWKIKRAYEGFESLDSSACIAEGFQLERETWSFEFDAGECIFVVDMGLVDGLPLSTRIMRRKK